MRDERLKGLEDAAKETQYLTGDPYGDHVQIVYSRRDHEVFGVYETSGFIITRYGDPDLVPLLDTHAPLSVSELEQRCNLILAMIEDWDSKIC